MASTSSRRSWLLIELASVGERLPMDETRRVRWDHDALLLAVDDDERLSAAVERYRIHGRLPRLVAIGQQLLEREKLTLEAQWRLEATLQQLLQRPRVALPRARRSRRPVPARQAPGWRGSLTG